MATIRDRIEFLPQYQNVTVLKPDPDDGRKSYVVDDMPYKRVSTALGIINKPALVPWAKKMTLEKVEEVLRNPEVATGLKMLFAEPVSSASEPGYNAWVDLLLATAKSAADQKRDAAAGRGTSIHEQVQAVLCGAEGVEQVVADEVGHALDFISDWSINVEGVEVTVWDEDLGVAGTLDAVGRNHQGKRIIWDWKTGSGPWWEMALQLGAYARMLEGLTGEPVADAYIVKLKPETYEVHRVLYLADAWDTFVHAAKLQSASSVKWFG